jgi:hypothetical protein
VLQLIKVFNFILAREKLFSFANIFNFFNIMEFKEKILFGLILLFLSSCASIKERRLIKDKDNLVTTLKEILENDQEYRIKIKDLKKSDINIYKDSINSLKSKQIEIDKINTLKLIKIVKKYGFPNSNRIDNPFPVWIIFQHTPIVYKEKVRKLLAKEYKSKRIGESEYKMILWHLDGRKELNFKDI